MIVNDVMNLLRAVKPIGSGPITIEPASEDDIQRFERLHSFVMPNEAKNWFRRSNGANVNPGGLYSLFPKKYEGVCIDWYFRRYPEWKSHGWIPIANDGCGDIYILANAITIPTTGTHPVFFLDQSDFSKPDYAVASGLWKFLFFLLEDEILSQKGEEGYWPFNSEKVLAADPALAECGEIPMPWQTIVPVKVLNVYKRRDGIYVNGFRNTIRGNIATPHFVQLAANARAVDVGAAIKKVLASLSGDTVDMNISAALQDYKEELKNIGFSDPSMFEREASVIGVKQSNQSLTIVRYAHHPTLGLVAVDTIVLSNGISAEDIGKIVLGEFAGANLPRES